MSKFVCTVCGYVHEGETAPEECPVCHQPGSKFREEVEKAVGPEGEAGEKADAPAGKAAAVESDLS